MKNLGDPPATPQVLDDCLRLGNGFKAEERPGILATFASLDARLQSFRAGSVELLLAVKERDKPSQRTTLEARIARTNDLVAHSTHGDIAAALIEVRDDLIRQITDAKNQTEPRNNRRLRIAWPGRRARRAR